MSERNVATMPVTTGLRARVSGKFIFLGGKDKFYVRGVTYGTFRPGVDGNLYPQPDAVERDFARMAANGLNAVRTYTVPPRWLLDAARRHGLYVMVGLPWEQHITFLDDRRRVGSIEDRVRAGVRACAGHPAVLCYVIGNEIPASIVRWYGPRRVERYLKRLYHAAKGEDPGSLVTYVNYPSTEYLRLPFVDFVAFNVYLEEQEDLEAYLARLHNVAGDKPVLALVAKEHHVRDREAPRRLKNPVGFGNHPGLVGGEVDDAVGDHHVHVVFGQRYVLDVAPEELDVLHPGLSLVLLGQL